MSEEPTSLPDDDVPETDFGNTDAAPEIGLTVTGFLPDPPLLAELCTRLRGYTRNEGDEVRQLIYANGHLYGDWELEGSILL